MQLRSLFAAAAAAGGLLIAGQAAAAGAFHAEARLAASAAAPATAKIGDASWTCQADACVGEAAHRSLDNPVRECRKVAAVLGPVAAYSTGGAKLDDGDLKACNVAAAKTTVSATAK